MGSQAAAAFRLSAPLRAFLTRLKLESRSAPGGVLLGVSGLGVLGRAVEAGHWGTAAGALGFLGLVLASPVVGALLATRQLLRKGYAQADIIHALRMDLDRQRQELASRWGRVTDATATVARRIAMFGLSLFGLGTLAAALGINLPEGLVVGSMTIGAFTTLLAGGVLVWRERRRNELTGQRLLRFWQSPLGEWTVKLAGIGLGARPPEPEPAGLPLPAGAHRAVPSELGDLADVADLTESCIRRIRARRASASVARVREARSPTLEEVEFEQMLERQLAVLEALLDKFLAEDAATAEPGSLTADLEAARAVCEAVEGLIEGREWQV